MMASRPQHPNLLFAIKEVVQNIQSHSYGSQPLDITGPTAIKMSMDVKATGYRKRVNFVWLGTRLGVRDISTRKIKIAAKDEVIHKPHDPETYYTFMWLRHQVYCDEYCLSCPQGMCDRN